MYGWFLRMRDRFKQLLAETGYVTAGKRLDEVRVLFMGRESFDSLTEHDRQIIYDQHQKEITEKARSNYMVSEACLRHDAMRAGFWVFSLLHILLSNLVYNEAALIRYFFDDTFAAPLWDRLPCYMIYNGMVIYIGIHVLKCILLVI